MIPATSPNAGGYYIPKIYYLVFSDALEDFNKPLPKNDAFKQNEGGGGEWSEEFIQQATRNFEAAMRAMASKSAYHPQMILFLG